MNYGFDNMENGFEVRMPLRTFAEMEQIFSQYTSGLLTMSEAILALQCTRHQVEALITHVQLPYAMQSKVSLADWDEHIKITTERDLAILNNGQVTVSL